MTEEQERAERKRERDAQREDYLRRQAARAAKPASFSGTEKGGASVEELRACLLRERAERQASEAEQNLTATAGEASRKRELLEASQLGRAAVVFFDERKNDAASVAENEDLASLRRELANERQLRLQAEAELDLRRELLKERHRRKTAESQLELRREGDQTVSAGAPAEKTDKIVDFTDHKKRLLAASLLGRACLKNEKNGNDAA